MSGTRVENINSSLSRQMNGSNDAAFALKELRLNDQTMVQHRGKYFILKKDDSQAEWLQLSLVVVDVATLEVSASKVHLLKHTLSSMKKNGQSMTPALIKSSNCVDAKMELMANPIDPRSWCLLIQGTYERRVFICQLIDPFSIDSFKFYEYPLNFPGFKTVRWTPFSRDHLFVLYKNKLEVVDYLRNFMKPETVIDLSKLYFEKYSEDVELEYVDLGFHQSNSPDFSVFSVFLITKTKQLHMISPLILRSFDLEEKYFTKLIDNSKKEELGQSALSILCQISSHPGNSIHKEPGSTKLIFQTVPNFLQEVMQLAVIPVKDIGFAERGQWVRCHFLSGSDYPIFLVSERISNASAAKLNCYLYPDKIRSSLYLQTPIHHFYEFQLPLNERIVSIRTAKDVRWNYPRVLFEENGLLTVLSFNRLFTLDWKQVLRSINKKEHAKLKTLAPKVSILFENQVHVNKQPDEFDSGYYAIHLEPQRVATVRLYDQNTPVFQLSPILSLESTSTLREQIKHYLTSATRQNTKPLPALLAKKQSKPGSSAPSATEIKSAKEGSQLLDRINQLVQRSERSMFHTQQHLTEDLALLQGVHKDMQTNQSKKDEFDERIRRMHKNNKRIQELKKAQAGQEVESELRDFMKQVRQDHTNIQSIVRKQDHPELNNSGAGDQFTDILERLTSLKDRMKKLKTWSK